MSGVYAFDCILGLSCKCLGDVMFGVKVAGDQFGVKVAGDQFAVKVAGGQFGVKVAGGQFGVKVAGGQWVWSSIFRLRSCACLRLSFIVVVVVFLR